MGCFQTLHNTSLLNLALEWLELNLSFLCPIGEDPGTNAAIDLRPVEFVDPRVNAWALPPSNDFCTVLMFTLTKTPKTITKPKKQITGNQITK